MLSWIRKFKDIYRLDDFTFYDIGSNIGLYGIFASKIYPNATVICFEPDATSFSGLCKNIYINNLNNVIPYQLALSDKIGFNLLHVSILDSGAGASAIGEGYKFVKNGAILKQGIFEITLDALYNDPQFPVPNFIKIDVDGFEHKILQAAEKTLSDSKLLGLIVELEFNKEEELNKLFNYLEKCGLSLVEKRSWNDKSAGTNIKNFIFMRK